MDRSEIRILIGCETSQVGQRAFEAAGFDSYSCDFIAAAKQAQILIKDCKCGADINDVMARRSEKQLFLDALCR